MPGPNDPAKRALKKHSKKPMYSTRKQKQRVVCTLGLGGIFGGILTSIPDCAFSSIFNLGHGEFILLWCFDISGNLLSRWVRRENDDKQVFDVDDRRCTLSQRRRAGLGHSDLIWRPGLRNENGKTARKITGLKEGLLHLVEGIAVDLSQVVENQKGVEQVRNLLNGTRGQDISTGGLKLTSISKEGWLEPGDNRQQILEPRRILDDLPG